MTSVLLISDTERVQRIFQTLEGKEVLKLHTASTLPSGEAQITASPCDFTFVQSRISGFSGDILLRHLEKMLHKGAVLVLLAGDAEDAEQARKHGRQSVDLTLADDLLAQTLLAVVTGAPLPEQGGIEAPSATKPAAAKEAAPPASPPDTEEKEAERSGAFAASPSRVADPEASPFEEAIQRAAANVAPIKASLLEVEERVEIGKSGAGTGKTPASPVAAGQPVRPDDIYAGETLLEAMRRAEKKKSRRPYLLILPALVLIAIPFISYTVGKRSPANIEIAQAFKPAAKPSASPQALPPKAAPAAPPAALAEKPAPPPAQPALPPATPQTAKPAPPPPPATAARPEPTAPAAQKAAPPAATAAKPAAKRGAERLPPVLKGTKPDLQYGKTHPGWERYLGLRAEYKLFRENHLYKALQVVSVDGGAISEDLFRRILREFGGADDYRVESSEKKGGYLVEQGSTKGNTALTIYRNHNNRTMKGFVVYYR
ncbi:histidine kinase [Citrifermentans bremense]|uniref:histidine kinase n=1 Tax=Citrifermentans bremense TaxID=60035 RepID=UPI00040784E2|nr:histidine kinase [Citrifermentans bremense]